MARILLVDDEQLARGLYADFLGAAGHQVTAVSGLREAKKALAAERFDGVVTDLILHEGNGMDILQHAKEAYPGIEVVVITALDKVDPAVRAIKSGAAEYLVKPVSPEALQLAVTRALHTRQLLRENESLRRHVTVLEAGQRIATTLDKERLLYTAASAFLQVCGADAVLIFVRQGSGELKLLKTTGDAAVEEASPAIQIQVASLMKERRALTVPPLPHRGGLPRPGGRRQLGLRGAALQARAQ